jgi:hypothetical protein
VARCSGAWWRGGVVAWWRRAWCWRVCPLLFETTPFIHPSELQLPCSSLSGDAGLCCTQATGRVTSSAVQPPSHRVGRGCNLQCSGARRVLPQAFDRALRTQLSWWRWCLHADRGNVAGAVPAASQSNNPLTFGVEVCFLLRRAPTLPHCRSGWVHR